MVGICEEGEREGVLLLEANMRGLGVGTDAQNRRAATRHAGDQREALNQADAEQARANVVRGSRLPRRENVAFHASREDAERAARVRSEERAEVAARDSYRRR